MREYEWHGRELVPHLRGAFSAEWHRQKADNIRRRLERLEDGLEAGWSLLERDRSSVPLIEAARDGYEAFQMLKAMGGGPPTMRLLHLVSAPR